MKVEDADVKGEVAEDANAHGGSHQQRERTSGKEEQLAGDPYRLAIDQRADGGKAQYRRSQERARVQVHPEQDHRKDQPLPAVAFHETRHKAHQRGFAQKGK